MGSVSSIHSRYCCESLTDAEENALETVAQGNNQQRLEFDPKWKERCMSLSSDRKTVTMKHGKFNSGSIFFPDIICNGHHEIKFKIVNKSFKMMIGIWSVSKNNKELPLNTWNGDGYGYGYGYDITEATKNETVYTSVDAEYGVEVKDGDIVIMIIDLPSSCWSSGNLSYKVNNKDFGTAHEIKYGSYKVAVYMNASDQDTNDAIIQII